MSSAVYLWKTFRAQAEQHSGVSQKVFGFSPESVFALRPECCSESARNPVRLHPGMLFALPRNTHVPSLKANSEAKNQLEAWIEAYEATAVLAYPSLRNLPDGDAIGPEFVVMVTSEIVWATRARLMTAGLDMIFSLLSGRVPISYALQGTAESTGTSSE